MRLSALVVAAFVAEAAIEPLHTAQWPRPKSGYLTPSTSQYFCVTGAGKFAVAASSKMACATVPSPITTAVDLINSFYRKETTGCTGGAQLKNDIVINYDACAALGPGIDESYTVDIDAAGTITVTAANQFGARHGLASVGNLFEARWTPYVADKMDDEYKYMADPMSTDKYFILPYPTVRIEDAPRLPHRGIMIDTARTYLPVDQIQKTVVAMGMVKMNVLHWHLADDQSFPALFDTAAGDFMKTLHGADCSLSQTGYCRGLMAPGAYYTDQDLKDIVALGEAHGVRIIFEIDQPGHAASWAAANRDLLYWRGSNTREPFYETWGVLNIWQKGDEIWNKLAAPIMKHIMSIAKPGEHIHFGADEFPSGVFGPDVNESDYVEPWLEKVIKAIEGDNRRSVAWQDGLKMDAGSNNPKVIAHIWDNADAAVTIANTGHDIVWSPATIMYLDCGRGNTVIPDLGSWCQPYTTWYQVYLETPDILIHTDPAFDTQNAGTVIGGEVALWNDARNMHEQDIGLWPRAAAWAGASWEERTEIPISAMVATDRDTLNRGISHAVEAQTQLGFIARKIRLFNGLPVAAFFQDYCLFKGSTLCDNYIKVWYTESFEAKLTSTTTPEPKPCGAKAKIVGFTAAAAALVALV